MGKVNTKSERNQQNGYFVCGALLSTFRCLNIFILIYYIFRSIKKGNIECTFIYMFIQPLWLIKHYYFCSRPFSQCTCYSSLFLKKKSLFMFIIITSLSVNISVVIKLHSVGLWGRWSTQQINRVETSQLTK